MKKNKRYSHPRWLSKERRDPPCIPGGEDEVFVNGVFCFHISAVLDWLKKNPQPTVSMPIHQWGPFGDEVDSYVDAVDITHPIVIAEIAPDYRDFISSTPENDWVGRGYVCIDGQHRLEKANKLGLETLPAVILRMEQHISFLYSGYDQYVEYWNSKLEDRMATKGDGILSLPDALAQKSVSELKKVAKGFRVKGFSAMRKDELIRSVYTALQVPERLEELLYVIDDETWTVFRSAAEQISVQPDETKAADLPLLEELCYLIPVSDTGRSCVYVPEEIKAVFANLVAEGFLARKAHFSLIHAYAMAAISLYGVIKQDDFVSIFNQQNEHKTDIDEAFNVLIRFVAVGAPYCFWEDYIVCDEFEENDYEDVWDLVRQVGNKPRYLPEKEKFLRYSDWDYFEQTSQTEAVRNFLVGELKQDETATDELLVEVHFACAVEAGMQAIIDVLDESGIELSDAQFERLAQLLVKMSNSTRLWSNNGHTPDELFNLRPNMVDGIRRVNKIGRNEPCPCGSGKKYKRCCGR